MPSPSPDTSEISAPAGSGPLFYITPPYACSYLHGQSACSQVMEPQGMHSSMYSELVKVGFRRTGHFVYRPCCVGCKACISVRVAVDVFSPNRAQKRVQRAHTTLVARNAPFQYDAEHHLLYQRYQAARHEASVEGDAENCAVDEMQAMDKAMLEKERYASFLLRSSVESRLIEFREPDSAQGPGALRMVTLMDILSDGLSCVYTFYDPDVLHASYGTYSILWHIAQAKRLQLPYVYLGYWIKDSVKMAYKINFQPLEGYVEGKWIALAK